MSPEQMQSSKDVDARTDIWALGIILHELLTGTPPFTGETLPEICAKVITQPPASTRERRPDTPIELDAVIQRCLRKNPQERYANIGEVALALAPFGPPRARTSVERILRVVRTAGIYEGTAVVSAVQANSIRGTQSDTISPLGQTVSSHPRRRVFGVAVLGAAFLASATVLGFVLVKRTGSDAPTPSSLAAPGQATAAPILDTKTVGDPKPAMHVAPVVSHSPASGSSAIDTATAARVDPLPRGTPAPPTLKQNAGRRDPKPTTPNSDKNPPKDPAVVPPQPKPPSPSGDDLGGQY
jgi:serine/threonine-protein kinase